jgi:hypothetical protein
VPDHRSWREGPKFEGVEIAASPQFGIGGQEHLKAAIY